MAERQVRCVVHFQPVEKYPPAVNFLTILAAEKQALEVHLFTTDPGEGRSRIAIPGVVIHRFPHAGNKGRFARILLYMRFIGSTLRSLVRLKPSSVLYYESISAGAPCLYKKWFNRQSRLFIHYHEYTSIEEYQSNMILNRWFYKLEKSLYAKATWVSHCNEDRMRLFLKDVGNNKPPHTYILPNHPPAYWLQHARDEGTMRTKPAGLVYVGALSMEHFFVREMASWVAANPDKIYWDIYSDNCSAEAIDFLKAVNAPNIQFHGAVAYTDLPALLPKYTAGVILYTGHIPNYVYNVPNKLFEYYCCGLDTWFPNHMVSCMRLETTDTWPKIQGLNFTDLERVNIDQLLDISNYRYEKNNWTAEKTCQALLAAFSAQ